MAASSFFRASKVYGLVSRHLLYWRVYYQLGVLSMKKLLFALSALSVLGAVLASVVPADAGSCPPGKRWYCSGSKCGCV